MTAALHPNTARLGKLGGHHLRGLVEARIVFPDDDQRRDLDASELVDHRRRRSRD